MAGCSNPHLEIFPELENPQLDGHDKIPVDLLKGDIQSYYLGALAQTPSFGALRKAS